MGLDVADMIKNNKWNDNECIKCGKCVSACKCGAININFEKVNKS